MEILKSDRIVEINGIKLIVKQDEILFVYQKN